MAKDTLKTKWNFTLVELNRLLAALKTLLNQAKTSTVKHPLAGVCENLATILGPMDHLIQKGGDFSALCALVAELSRGWNHPLNRKQGRFFIEGYWKHHDADSLWTDEQLAARISLIRYLIKRLRDWQRQTELDTLRRHLKESLAEPGNTGARYSQALLRDLLLSLRKLHAHALANQVPDTGLGICDNWESLGGHRCVFRVTSVLASYWPGSKHPGRYIAFPVPHDKQPDGSNYALWEGPQKERRLDLIRFMEVRLEALSRKHE